MMIRVMNNCIGCGACATVSPEVFEINKNYAIVNQDKISENEDSCIDATLCCPVNAIDLHEY